jgi:hypothetical protein
MSSDGKKCAVKVHPAKFDSNILFFDNYSYYVYKFGIILSWIEFDSKWCVCVCLFEMGFNTRTCSQIFKMCYKGMFFIPPSNLFSHPQTDNAWWNFFAWVFYFKLQRKLSILSSSFTSLGGFNLFVKRSFWSLEVAEIVRFML